MKRDFICDFCSTGEVIKFYDVKDIDLGFAKIKGKTISHTSKGSWAACKTCSELIDKRDKRELISFCTKEISKINPQLKEELRLEKKEYGLQSNLEKLFSLFFFELEKSEGNFIACLPESFHFH